MSDTIQDIKPVFKFKATLELPYERISDLLAGAIEGGSNYWCETADAIEPTSMPYVYDKNILYRRYQYPLNPGGRLDVKAEDDDKVYTLDLKSIEKGLKLLAKDHATVLGRIMEGQDDAGDADIFFQLCLFGKVIYG